MIERLLAGVDTALEGLVASPLAIPALVLFVVAVFLAVNGRAR